MGWGDGKQEYEKGLLHDCELFAGKPASLKQESRGSRSLPLHAKENAPSQTTLSPLGCPLQPDPRAAGEVARCEF